MVDDRAAQLTGAWKSSSANQKFVDSGYQHNDKQQPGEKSATFETKLTPGKYEVRISYPPNANRASNVPVTVTHIGGTTRLIVNQRQPPPIDRIFHPLGEFEFVDTASVTVGTENTNGYVVIDAVQFLPVDE